MPIKWDEPKPKKQKKEKIDVVIPFRKEQEFGVIDTNQYDVHGNGAVYPKPKPTNLPELVESMEEQLRKYQGTRMQIIKRPSDSQLRILITYWQKSHTRSANRTDTIEGQFYQEMQEILENLQ